MASRWLHRAGMSKYDKELQSNTEEYEEAMEPLDTPDGDESDEDEDDAPESGE
jgi:hypothetical protein